MLLGILLITLFIISDAYNRNNNLSFAFPKTIHYKSKHLNINLMLYAREKKQCILILVISRTL